MFKHTPGPWRWIRCENGEGSDSVLFLAGSPDEWQRCEYFCFGWPEAGSFRSRGPLSTPGHEHNYAPTVLSASGWHGSGDLNIDPEGPDARLIAAAPELLEACKLALGAFENNNAIDWNVLSDAIAKAEGI